MDFDSRLSRIFKVMLEDEDIDYVRDWEKLQQERHQPPAPKVVPDFDDEDEYAGMSDKDVWGYRTYQRWRPAPRLVIIEDIETGNGLLLPSLQKKGVDLYLFISWAIAEVTNPTPETDGYVGKIYPFCQFEEDKWPNKGDFDWDLNRSYFGGKEKLDEKAAMQLFQSDKNHYHILRGADKDVVDRIVENKVDDWFRDHQEIEKYEDYED